MKIDRKLEIKYCRAIQKSRFERTKIDKANIYKRNDIIYSQFEWTPEIKKTLALLNEKLRIEEKRIFMIYRQIENQCKLMVKNKQIDGFRMDIEMALYSNYYDTYDPGIGYFCIPTIGNFMFWQDNEEYDSRPWYEHYNGAPLPEISHCFTFFFLWEGNDELTWFDICNIDEVGMDIKVDYEFSVKVT
ncbi:MAG: hypothetical protein Q7T12_04140 [Flavobacterium sp.]|nr:hypothetical protein [Flavobacterium sp.]